MTITVITAVIYIFIFLFGASVFSFINVLIYRVPREMKFGNERSICPTCGKMLKGYDMVPVFSYLVLGGKCRFCKSSISPRYPLIEAAGGFLAVLSAYEFGQLQMCSVWAAARAGVVFLLLAILMAVAFVDIDTMEIPNGFVIAALICGLLSIILFPEVTLWGHFIGFFSVSVPLALITMIIPGAFGGGDIKLMTALGLFMGWKISITAFAIAVLSGGAYGIYLLAGKKKGRKDHFAFGPFLCLGTATAIFYGTSIIEWYLGFLK